MAERTKITDLRPGKFDLKIMAYGNSGTGKTHFGAFYTHGPIHCYAFDPHASTILRKSPNKEVTISEYHDDLNEPTAYADLWRDLQKDLASGFIQDLANRNGLVMVDSFTLLTQSALHYVVSQDGLKSVKTKNNMGELGVENAYIGRQPETQHWNRQLSLLQQFIRGITALPCAVYLTAHIYLEKNSDGNVVAAAPLTTGQMRATTSIFFAETYYLKQKFGDRIFCPQASLIYPATTRIFPGNIQEIKNLTMDEVYEYYLNNKLPMGASTKPS